MAGARPLLLLSILGGGLAVVVLALLLHFSPLHLPLPLKEYQIARLVVFLDPYSDPQGFGYHIIQSLVAIGSGGLWGKGLYHGSQVQLNFLPEHHTDFIFSVVGEELGLIGAGFLLVLYYIMLSRTLQIAFQARIFWEAFDWRYPLHVVVSHSRKHWNDNWFDADYGNSSTVLKLWRQFYVN